MFTVLTRDAEQYLTIIAERNSLNEDQTKRFVAYVLERFGLPHPDYASQWAQRFKAGMEMAVSDSVGQAILLRQAAEVEG